MYVSNSRRGIRAHCFRCGESAFEPHGRLSSSEFLEMRREDARSAVEPLPDTVQLYSDDVPSWAKVWTLRAGITPERASDTYKFGYYAKTERVIVPILHNSKPTDAWIGRGAEGRRPKYRMSSNSDGAVWYDIKPGNTVCAVEDVLSAIKLHEAGYSVVCVLGTSITTSATNLMLGREVIGWFDPDEAGRRAFVKLRKALAPFGIEPTKKTSERDPKYYSKREIRSILDGRP